MSRIVLTPDLRQEYQDLFSTCDIRSEHATAIDHLASALLAERDRYHAAGASLGIPWFVVAALHYGETGGDFTVHLHNGDPLTDRTQHLPADRPLTGEPPFHWEDSASDALRLHYDDRWTDWSIAGVLFRLESHGGWSYRLRQPPFPSPYLWHGSMHYSQGKYAADNVWSETAVPQRYGVAVILRRLAELGFILFSDPELSVPEPLVRYTETEVSPWVIALQRFLNTLPGVYLKVDGYAGPRTSAAFGKLTGQRLPGDPHDIAVCRGSVSEQT